MGVENNTSYIAKEDVFYLKGWAILVMIFLHIFGTRAINIPGYSLLVDFQLNGQLLSFQISKFCSICVHLYIFLSGYGFYIIYRRKVEKNIGMNIIQRITFLLIKVFLVGVLFYPISFFYPNLGWEFDSIKDVCKLFLGYSGNYEWWFLSPYIVITLFSLFILSVFDRYPYKTLCISFILCYLMKFQLHYNIFTGPLILQQVSILLFPFLLGTFSAKYSCLLNSGLVLMNNVLIPITIIVIMVVFKMIFPFGLLDPFFSMVFVFCMVAINKKLNIRFLNILNSLGREATSMWLIHTFVAIYYWNEFVYSFRYPIVVFLAVVIISYILSKLVAVIYNPIKSLVA